VAPGWSCPCNGAVGVVLPSGTVTLLFSDIEGSTVLLSRLGDAYVDALSGQRRVLREAWAQHGGTELGTEGDSFFVVFSTAEGAVAAACQAQRELASYPWQGGERVWVRMGIHTGTPVVHDGGYVGMDVHRAARIAGAAHGGQVVVSSATAELVGGCLPEDVGLRDLGRHRLKDITRDEHLFELSIEGLASDFPPLKSLGAASSLPRPTTPLVGRDGELAELTALLSSAGWRLVTLTGPGGSGKTRLAIGLARGLVATFPDGVYFVPLAAATSAEVMWTSIAEVLDVPAEGRIPPGFFTHVAHRSALLVLDNLEQFGDADEVVADLLREAPQVVVVATSRRPLHVEGEHQHPVPTLELPDSLTDLAQASASGAVQLFVERAGMVRPGFALSPANAADVVMLCRRLDGLPLAIELAAARSKFLSPAALVARIDQALDIASSGKQAPARQRTLRDTIGWSYDLLPAEQQMLFRRLGVFAGGADLEAIAAVASDAVGDEDMFDLVTDLVDASLITIGDDDRGEPRIGMLESIRAYAQDQLRRQGELDAVRSRHAHHYMDVAGDLSPKVVGSAEEMLRTQRRFEREVDNFREALHWALTVGNTAGTPSLDRVLIGMRLCAGLHRCWAAGGYYGEGRHWLEAVIRLAGDDDDSEKFGACYWGLAALAQLEGDRQRAYDVMTHSVARWRRLGDKRELSSDLNMLGIVTDDMQEARHVLEEAIALARDVGDKARLADALQNLAHVEQAEHDYDRALALQRSALDLYRDVGNDWMMLTVQHNVACVYRALGQPEEACRQVTKQLPQMVQLADPSSLISIAEDYAAVLADLGDHEHAARLLGATDAMREQNGITRDPLDTVNDEASAKARAAMPTDAWTREYQRGSHTTVEDALAQAQAANVSR
jgi:predicted ATPase/class 3 adenylate cyclase